VPLDREHCLGLAYIGEVPKELFGQEEADLPRTTMFGACPR
jgi:hypothetical protein